MKRGRRHAARVEVEETKSELLRKADLSHLSEFKCEWYIRIRFVVEFAPLLPLPKLSHGCVEILFSCLLHSPLVRSPLVVLMSRNSSPISFNNHSSMAWHCQAVVLMSHLNSSYRRQMDFRFQDLHHTQHLKFSQNHPHHHPLFRKRRRMQLRVHLPRHRLRWHRLPHP